MRAIPHSRRGVHEVKPEDAQGRCDLHEWRVYEELRALAAAAMRGERGDHTLQATALANEAYVRLERSLGPGSLTHAQFMMLASRTVRRVLVDHARRRRAECRGGGRAREEFRGDLLEAPDVLGGERVIELDEMLHRLHEVDPRKAEVVELRCFGGLTVEQVAEHLGLSVRSVAGDWAMARAWLRRELGLAEPRGA